MTEPKVFKLLPSEVVLPDDYPINPGYVYICDGQFTRYSGYAESTIGLWKSISKLKEVRRCSLFEHEGARLGDRVE